MSSLTHDGYNISGGDVEDRNESDMCVTLAVKNRFYLFPGRPYDPKNNFQNETAKMAGATSSKRTKSEITCPHKEEYDPAQEERDNPGEVVIGLDIAVTVALDWLRRITLPPPPKEKTQYNEARNECRHIEASFLYLGRDGNLHQC